MSIFLADALSTTCAVYRPFGAGSPTTTGVGCRLVPDAARGIIHQMSGIFISFRESISGDNFKQPFTADFERPKLRGEIAFAFFPATHIGQQQIEDFPVQFAAAHNAGAAALLIALVVLNFFAFRGSDPSK